MNGESGGKYLQCLDDAKDTLTHNNNDEKDSISVKWMAPDGFTDKFHFEASVVEEKVKFWTGVMSEKMRVGDMNRAAGMTNTTTTLALAATLAALVMRWFH